MINLPIFRAKKIDSDEYVIGYFWKSPETLENFIAVKDDLTKTLVHIKIDITTIAINFPDMLDSQGNKIFASLSEDGKGGDRLEAFNKIFIAKYSKEDGSFLVVSSSGSGLFSKNYLKINFKVIGIQQ